MTIRVYYVLRGEHVHCRVFTGSEGFTFANVGQLTFAAHEWDGVRNLLQGSVEFVPDAATPAGPRVRLDLCQSCALEDHARCVGETTLGTSLCMCDCNAARRAKVAR